MGTGLLKCHYITSAIIQYRYSEKTRQYCQAMFLELVDYFDSYFYMSPFCICKLNNGPLSSKSLVKTNYQEYHQ